MLRVGIVLDSYISSAWVAKVIEDIQSSGFARVELTLLNGDRRQPGVKTGQEIEESRLEVRALSPLRAVGP